MFKIEIDTGNAAFEDAKEAETARILFHVAFRIERGETSGKIHDSNGNPIGSFSFDWEG